MDWWMWLVAAGLLLAIEVSFDTQFYVLFLGMSAGLVGLVGLAGLGGPLALDLALFGVISGVSIVSFRRALYERVIPARIESQNVIAAVAVLNDSLAPGATGEASLRGTVWRVRNVSSVALEAGAEVRVEKVEGVVLDVLPKS